MSNTSPTALVVVILYIQFYLYASHTVANYDKGKGTGLYLEAQMYSTHIIGENLHSPHFTRTVVLY